MKPNFHKNQTMAILHDKGPMLVLAGPGSGKTTVIVHRIQNLTQSLHVPEQKILVITFTKSAAIEMQQRYEQLCTNNGVLFGTFHSIFFRILRKSYGYQVGQVLQEGEKIQFLRQYMRQYQFEVQDEDEYIHQFSNQLSLMKNELQTYDTFTPEGLPKQEFIQLANAFEQYKQQQKKLDFDDMLVQCHTILSTNKAICTYWQNRFDYILVDEFQDINFAQYECLKLLATPKNNIFVVGDDDQSIYGFRGARPDFMLTFPKQFSETKIVSLDVNYRCCERIIHAAARTITQNEHRYEKEIVGNREKGEKIHIFTAEENIQEADMIAEKIVKKLEQNISAEQIAVIYRTNIQANAFARALYRKGVPYYMRDGGVNFYDHWIAKDLQAYLHLAESPESDSALRRILNKPKRYISKELLTQAEQLPYALIRNLFLLPELQKYQSERLTQLQKDIIQISKRNVQDAIRYIRTVVGYDEYLMEYADYRKANLSHLMEILNELTDTAKDIKTPLQWTQYLEELRQQLKQQPQTKPPHAVTLTTFHGAKGLEFDVVFLPSLVEGILPHERSKATKQQYDLEEERRLFYVGMTRAKNTLYLSCVKKRYDKYVKHSRFLTEIGIPASLLQRK